MVKIGKTGPVAGAGKAQSASKASAADRARFASSVDALDKPEAAATASGASAAQEVAPVDALLAIQEVGTASDGRSKGLADAAAMLDLLEDVRRGLILGSIPQNKLKALADLARTQRDDIVDPGLSAVLDDIELRAEVELAKLER